MSRLSAVPLDNVADVNNYDVVSEAHISEGQANDIYVQLINKSKHEIRYMPQGAVISVSAEFSDINDASVISIAGTQPFTDDKSIWKFSLTSSQIPNSGTFILTLTEDGVSRKIKVTQGLIVELLEDGGC